MGVRFTLSSSSLSSTVHGTKSAVMVLVTVGTEDNVTEDIPFYTVLLSRRPFRMKAELT